MMRKKERRRRYREEFEREVVEWTGREGVN